VKAASEPPALANAPQMAVSMTLTVAPVVPVPAGTAASKNAHRNGCECGQESRQVAAGVARAKGRLAEGRCGHAEGRHTLS